MIVSILVMLTLLNIKVISSYPDGYNWRYTDDDIYTGNAYPSQHQSH